MVGIYTIDVSMMSAESTVNSKQLDVVCFGNKSCVLANKNLNVNYMYFV